MNGNERSRKLDEVLIGGRERHEIVHAWCDTDPEVTRSLRFRDRLRRSAEDRSAYEQLKRELARRDRPDMNHYADAFADATGHVIGHFIVGEPAPEPGIIPYVYVDDLNHTVTLITGSGGAIAGEPRPEGTLHVATFRDPEGNLVGIWTETAAGSPEA